MSDHASRARPANAIGIALTAASVLAYQIVAMRTFAIETDAMFAGMVISVALLGFGISGTLLTVFRDPMIARRDGILFWSAAVAVPLLVCAHFIQQHVPFVALKLSDDPSQFWWLPVYYMAMLGPMFALSLYVGVTLVGFTRDVHKLYFADLAASGLGAFLVLGLLYVVPPQYLILIPVFPAAAGALVVARRNSERLICGGLLVASVASVLVWGEIRFNEYKGIRQTLLTSSVSGAKVIDTRFGPMGYIQIVSTRSNHRHPGASLSMPLGTNAPRDQHAIFVDGSLACSLAKKLTLEQNKYFDWVMTALPYQLIEKPRTLVPSVAGGVAIAEALHHGAPRVLGVAANPQFVSIMRDYSDYNGALLDRDGVEVRSGEGRAVAQSTDERFDVIILRGLNGSGQSVAAAAGSAESYLLTVEAMQAYLRALADGGIVTVMMKTWAPAYRALRLLPTGVAALRAEGVDSPTDKVVFVRDQDWGMLMLKPSGFDDRDVGIIRKWTRSRSIDVSYMPGITAEDVADQYTSILEETYADAARALVASASSAEKFVDDYYFDISPTTDDRPYFGSVVRLGLTDVGLADYQRRSAEAGAKGASAPVKAPAGEDVPDLDGGGDVPDLDGGGDVPDLDSGGPEDEPGAPEPVAPGSAGEQVTSEEFAEDEAAADDEASGFFAAFRRLPGGLWGIYVQLATLAQAAFFGLLIILIPLIGARRGIAGVRGKASTLVYFACLGLGFMCAEMVLIRKLTLLLASPLFAVTVVLAAILFFAGVGSHWAGRFADGKKAISVAVGGAITTVLLYILVLDPIIRGALGFPTMARILVAVILIAPVALFLGFAFPTGLTALDSDEGRRRLVPWAWAINGATSVVGAVGVELASTHFGFRAVLLAMCGFYALAWVTFPGRLADSGPPTSAQ